MRSSMLPENIFFSVWVIIYGLQVLLFPLTLWPTSTTSTNFHLHLCQNNNWDVLQHQSEGIWKISECLSHFCWYSTTESLYTQRYPSIFSSVIKSATLLCPPVSLHCSAAVSWHTVQVLRFAELPWLGSCEVSTCASVTVWHMPAVDTQPRGN